MSGSKPNDPPPARTEQGDATGGVIPYKNPHALAAYYLGLFSVIPGLGFFCALFAVPLGVSGLRKRSKRPVIRGAAHAWIGILFGSLSLLIHLGIIGLLIAAGMSRN